MRAGGEYQQVKYIYGSTQHVETPEHVKVAIHMTVPTICGADYDNVIVESFDVLTDTYGRRGPVIGIRVNPFDRDSFIMPLTFESAKDLCDGILETLRYEVAPELFD